MFSQVIFRYLLDLFSCEHIFLLCGDHGNCYTMNSLCNILCDTSGRLFKVLNHMNVQVFILIVYESV